jgi:hypothetical protein
MTISPFTLFTGNIGPLTRVTPFTHRDNATFLRILQELIQYINTTLTDEMNAELERILAEYTGIAEDWQTGFDAFMADVVAQIALLNDDAVASLVADLDTGTSNALDARYALATFLTSELASIRAESLKWAAGRAYSAGQEIVSPTGDLVTAYEAHTSGVAFDKNLWYADHGYLFANFTYNSPEGEKLNLFYSATGKATSGHGPNPVYAPATGLRDPSIIKIGALWYMAHGYTDPTQKKFAIASSPDLVNWSQVTEINVSGAAGLTRVWAPELLQDETGYVYVFFTTVVNEGTAHEAWHVKSTNVGLFTWDAPVKLAWTLQPTRCMDAYPVKKDGVWYLFYGDNNYICRATAPTMLGPWTTDRTADWAGWGNHKEAPQVVRVSENLWRVYVDRYEGVDPDWTYPGYAYAESTDLTTWTGLTPITMGPDAQGIALRHGSFIKINDRVSAAQVAGAIASGGSAQRYVEGTTGKSIPSGAETNIGPITIDGARSFVTTDFTFPADGQIKVGATGVYSFTLHGGDDPANNFLDGVTKQWVTIYSPTMGRNLARATGAGGFELSTDISNIRCNAGEIIEFRVAQFSGGPLPIDCRVHATRIS